MTTLEHYCLADPLCALAAEALKELGPTHAKAWFASRPELEALPEGKRRSIILQLYNSGIITKAGRTQYARTTCSGNAAKSLVTVWRLKRWHR